MNIAISGASGFIGKHLSAFLAAEGHQVIPLGRPMFHDNMSRQLVQALFHCDVIINLAGAPINKRWTPEYKKEIYDSRIQVTHRIIRALNEVRKKPLLMISASAVGCYPEHGISDEYTRVRGEGFLSDLSYSWEEEARKCPSQTRLVITRFGVVLSPDGGAMEQMMRPLKMKVGVVVGSGAQPFPWIDIRDLCRAMAFIIDNKAVSGVVNLVTPQGISQFAFTRAMADKYHAWITAIVPRSFFRLMYGEEGAAFLTTGQNVRPTRLLEAGFQFSVPTVEKLFQGADHSTVDRLNLSRYMGRWYEIARFDHRFERTLTGVTATYTLLPDGTIRVMNRGYKHKAPHDVCKTTEGRAKLPDATQPGKLKVSFFRWFYSDYYVMELDEEDYNYALLGSRSDAYLWLMSRTPVMPEDIKEKLLAAATRRGYDVSKFIWVQQ